MSGWPDEHVERMLTLWKDGLSATQVAAAMNAELRTSYSRNSVIGKIHRMGLPKRPKDTWLIGQRIEARRRAEAGRIARANAPPKPPKPQPQPKPQRVYLGIAMTAPVAPILPSTLAPPAPKPEPIPEGPGLATVLTLGIHMCRWPIGDPAQPDFTLCGRRKEEGGSYCRAHAARAYQPMAASKKKSANELIRSLRRYA